MCQGQRGGENELLARSHASHNFFKLGKMTLINVWKIFRNLSFDILFIIIIIFYYFISIKIRSKLFFSNRPFAPFCPPHQSPNILRCANFEDTLDPDFEVPIIFPELQRQFRDDCLIKRALQRNWFNNEERTILKGLSLTSSQAINPYSAFLWRF